jgi:Glycosyltransferase Family 4
MITPTAADRREDGMRIMVVTDQYEPMVGGVPAVTRELAHGLAERAHSVALVAPSPGWRGRRTTAWPVSVTFRGSLRWPWYEGMRLGCLPASAARQLIASFALDVQQLSWLSPSRWGFAAAASTSNLNQVTPPPPGNTPDPLWRHTAHVWLLDMAMQVALTVVLAGLAWWRLRQASPGRRR